MAWWLLILNSLGYTEMAPAHLWVMCECLLVGGIFLALIAYIIFSARCIYEGSTGGDKSAKTVVRDRLDRRGNLIPYGDVELQEVDRRA